MASTDDIDKRMKVGTAAWAAKHNKETQQLSAYRRLHALLPHEDVKKIAKPTDHPAKLAAIAKEVERQLKENK